MFNYLCSRFDAAFCRLLTHMMSLTYIDHLYSPRMVETHKRKKKIQ